MFWQPRNNFLLNPWRREKIEALDVSSADMCFYYQYFKKPRQFIAQLSFLAHQQYLREKLEDGTYTAATVSEIRIPFNQP